MMDLDSSVSNDIGRWASVSLSDDGVLTDIGDDVFVETIFFIENEKTEN